MRSMGGVEIAGGRGRWVPLILALAAAWLVALPAAAQTAALTLTVSKTFGFNNGSQIQGDFRLEASGPANLASVTFTLDGEPLGQVSAAPFTFDFNTDK
jgi:hypothetical protein